jgi:hypothetical protein
MAKKKSTEGDAGSPKMTTTKVDVDLLRKARMVAIYRGVDLHEYVGGILRPVVERDYAAMIREESRD